MNKPFLHLTQAGHIGSLQLKNRMIVTAMGVNLAEEGGNCGDRLLAYHERQAQGGAGLIVMGVAGVAWPSGGNLPRQTAISDDKHIPGLAKLADAVHQYDCKIAAQLHHAGMVAVQDSKEGRPIWLPSYPAKATSDLGEGMLMEEMMAFRDPDAPPPQLHVMTVEDIAVLIAQFADAAERAVKAGFDGVEIHGGHGYIISEFLSPALNQREDDYGGSLQNRARLLLEIIAAIRERVGKAFPLWVKLDCSEFGKAEGITLADAKNTAIMVEAAGADAITVSAYHDVSRGALHSESNIPHTPERLVESAAAIKTALGIPVITSGRIEPAAADKHIAKRHFDFLGMGRKLLADPDLPNKISAGTPEQVRPCVYCYCCVSQIYVMKNIKCAVNPETGKERERTLITTDAPALRQRHIVVVGGGPGGMEAARRLSIRGFQVSLIERGSVLGGTLQFASIAYPPNEKLLHWLRLQIKHSTVNVMLDTEATPTLLRQLGADEVVVATGAKRDMPDIPGNELDFVFSGDEMRSLVLAEDNPHLKRKTSKLTRLLVKVGAMTRLTRYPEVLRQASKVWLPLGKEITIIGAELVGLELAEFLAERGRKVTVIDSAAQAGKGLYLVRRLRLLEELKELGVTLVKKADGIVIEQGNGNKQVSYNNPGGQRRAIATDHVIVAQGATASSTLADTLTAEGFNTHSIGDCTGVSYIEGAMEAAAELAVNLN